MCKFYTQCVILHTVFCAETKSEFQLAPAFHIDANWEADQIQQGYLPGIAKQGSNCEECQQIIEYGLRYYPALCKSCSSSKTRPHIAS